MSDLPCLARWKDKWFNSPQFLVNDKEGRSFRCPDCVPSCNYIKYKIQSSFGFVNPKSIAGVELDNETNVEKLSLVHVFYARSFIKEYQQTILSDTYDLLSILGGVFSVMLGISLISVVELFFYLTGKFMTIWNCSQNLVKVKEDTKRQAVVQQESDTIGDLANIYWSEIQAMPPQRRRRIQLK